MLGARRPWVGHGGAGAGAGAGAGGVGGVGGGGGRAGGDAVGVGVGVAVLVIGRNVGRGSADKTQKAPHCVLFEITVFTVYFAGKSVENPPCLRFGWGGLTPTFRQPRTV